MTMMFSVPPVPDVILLPPAEEARLEPVYLEMPVIRPQRSAEERRCAVVMLDKLRRGEDLLPAACDGDRAMDVVVDKLIDRLG